MWSTISSFISPQNILLLLGIMTQWTMKMFKFVITKMVHIRQKLVFQHKPFNNIKKIHHLLKINNVKLYKQQTIQPNFEQKVFKVNFELSV